MAALAFLAEAFRRAGRLVERHTAACRVEFDMAVRVASSAAVSVAAFRVAEDAEEKAALARSLSVVAGSAVVRGSLDSLDGLPLRKNEREHAERARKTPTLTKRKI